MNEPSLVPYPAYSNQGTFLRSRRGTIDDVEPGMITVVGVPQDTTAASRPGARWGPASIRAASAGLDYFLRSTLSGELVDVETGDAFSYLSEVPLMDMGDVMTYPLDMERTVESVSTDIGAIVAKGGLPVVLGGDHFISYPAAKGVADALSARDQSFKLGYIHIDGDLDISDDNKTWGRLFHGTNARRISELPSLDPRRMVMFGISGVTRRDQWDFVHESGISMLTEKDIRRLGAAKAMAIAIEIAADGSDGIYVTCDIDVVDGAIAPGTGAIKFTGLTADELLDGATVLSSVPNIVGLDVVEVAPEWDPMGRTQVLAASYLTSLLGPRLFRMGRALPERRPPQ